MFAQCTDYRMFTADSAWPKYDPVLAAKNESWRFGRLHGPLRPTLLHLFGSCAEECSFVTRKISFPVDHVDCSVDFDWLHQSLSGYSGAGDSEVSLSLSPSLWQKLLLNGRVASFSVGVPSGPTGRDNQTGQLQTDRQTDAADWSCFTLSQTEAHLEEF